MAFSQWTFWLPLAAHDLLRNAGLQVLCSVAGADERIAPNLTMPQLQWLAETRFMSGLVEHLISSQENSDAGSNARTVLVGVARSPLSAPLLQPLLEPAFFQQLLDRAFTAPVSVQVRDRASLHHPDPCPVSVRESKHLHMHLQFAKQMECMLPQHMQSKRGDR